MVMVGGRGLASLASGKRQEAGQSVLFSRKPPELDPTAAPLGHPAGRAGAPVLVHLEVGRGGPVLPAAQGVHGNGAAERAGALAIQPEAQALLTEHVLRGQRSVRPGAWLGARPVPTSVPRAGDPEWTRQTIPALLGPALWLGRQLPKWIFKVQSRMGMRGRGQGIQPAA